MVLCSLKDLFLHLVGYFLQACLHIFQLAICGWENAFVPFDTKSLTIFCFSLLFKLSQSRFGKGQSFPPEYKDFSYNYNQTTKTCLWARFSFSLLHTYYKFSVSEIWICIINSRLKFKLNYRYNSYPAKQSLYCYVARKLKYCPV